MQDLRKRREKISKKNFESICVIGRGAFGEVRLCREKKNGRIVAIKCLNKKEMIKKNQQGHLKAERNILADGGEWIV
jgi:serine/threonine kinase 38